MKAFIRLWLCVLPIVPVLSQAQTRYTLQNKYMARSLTLKQGKLYTSAIVNKLNGKQIRPGSSEEFQIRLSAGTQFTGTDVVLTSADFTVLKKLSSPTGMMVFLLENKLHQLEVELHYELKEGESYCRKYLKIYTKQPVTIERVDVELIKNGDLYQPYTIKQITAQGPAQWRPGLGQPIYSRPSAFFMGIEFPAAYNYVEAGYSHCGYQWGNKITADSAYTSYKSVIGVARDTASLQDAFFAYIDAIRIRPFRLQIQYNSWFDFGPAVNKQNFAASVARTNEELVVKRGTPPLKAFVIDDGWQDVSADWSDTTWKVNQKFDHYFAGSLQNVRAAGSNLGLWLSPGCLFGAENAAKKYKKQGFETMGNWMSIAGPKYMQLLENRMIELTSQGVGYFKLDGIFGHLNTREFELNGQRYGIPSMPQLNTASLSPSDYLLNDPKFDELKTYYLVAGTERLMKIFQKQHAVNPNVYIVISNGAYLSPWWLMYIDAVWMINADDAAEGANRTQELAYRDGIYYHTWTIEKTQYPISAVFNHEPKKITTGESAEAFAQYLWMSLSRGTGFIELYIKTDKLSQSDWDVLASGLKWAHADFRYFKTARMHGGDPGKSEVYGFTGWNEKGGYISFHNPSDKVKVYTCKPGRMFGLTNNRSSYIISSPLTNAAEFTGKQFHFDETISVTLIPGEVKVLDFVKKQ